MSHILGHFVITLHKIIISQHTVMDFNAVSSVNFLKKIYITKTKKKVKDSRKGLNKTTASFCVFTKRTPI